MTVRAPSIAQLPVARPKRLPKPNGSMMTSLRSWVENFDAERDWFAQGMIEGTPTVLVIGPEKSGKSWLLQELIVATICGDSFLGRFPIQRPGPVLYLDAEYGQHETARRIIRLARARGRDATEIIDDLDYIYARGWTIKYERGEEKRDGKQATPNQTVRLASELRALPDHEKPSLIVVDPLRNFLAGSENDADAVVEFFLGLEVLKTSAQCPIVVAHHLNKAGGYSGSRALLGRADLIIEGSDEREPWYSAIGRTIRRGDAVAERFTVAIEHVDDADDAKAKTILRARFTSENRTKADLGKTTLRVLELVKEQGPCSARQLSLGKLAVGKVSECLKELEVLGRVRRGSKGWEASITEVISND